MNSKENRTKPAKKLSNIRNRKIAKLKAKITSGKYRVDNFEIAKALFFAR